MTEIEREQLADVREQLFQAMAHINALDLIVETMLIMLLPKQSAEDADALILTLLESNRETLVAPDFETAQGAVLLQKLARENLARTVTRVLKGTGIPREVWPDGL